MKMKTPITIVLAGVLVAVCAVWGQKQLTVEDIFGTDQFRTKTPRGVEWIPGGKAFTFEEKNSSGKILIRKYDVISGNKTNLFDLSCIGVSRESRREKRFAIPSYAWSKDGLKLLVLSADNLHLYQVQSGKLKQLTNDAEGERDPVFSPDGKKIAFLKKNNLHVLDVETGRDVRLTHHGSENCLIGRFDWVYEEEFSIRTGYFWSPDSKHIAFFELDPTPEPEFPIVDFIPIRNSVEFLRYPKAGDCNAIVRIGIVPDQGGTIRWMDIGDEKDIYIPRIQWLKDGKYLAIQRLNRRQNRLDLLFADAQTGKSKKVLTEDDPKGWVDPNDELTFLENKRQFIWSSERSNWKHLYLYDLEGRFVRQLTRGNWNVEQLKGVDEKGGWAYFTASEKSSIESHLVRTDLDGRHFQRLSSESGTHSINLSPDSQYYLDTFSDITTPDRTALYRSDGKIIRIVEPGTIEALRDYRLAKAAFLTVPTEDGLKLNAYLIKPVDFDSTKKYPVLIFTYGGPASQQVRNDWHSGGAGMGALWHQMMLQKGYLIFCLDNRGTGNQGNDFMNRVYRNMGLGVEDQIRKVKYLRGLPFVDGRRIGIWGWSGGGWMTCLALTRGAEYFKAGVAVAPVTDLRNYDTIWTERYMGLPQENQEGYDAGNPIEYIDRYKGGLFLAHGLSDDNVHAANSFQLAFALENARKPFQLMLYPKKDHGIRGKNTQVQLYNMITEFLLKNL